jgi:hypothetical protein
MTVTMTMTNSGSEGECTVYLPVPDMMLRIRW